jgi:hypothetical protein
MKCCILLIGLLFGATVYGQNPNPIIIGDNMLCPQGTGTVSTQQFDTYQWKRRYFGSSNTEVLKGETAQSLVMDYYSFAGSYISVSVTLNGASATSAEFLVDGYVFLPLFVISDGNYTIGPDGEFVICPGDSVVFSLGNSASVNIQWYKDGSAIAGANELELVVYQAGVYSVAASPAVCPNYVQVFGMDLVVMYCPVGVDERSNVVPEIFPNPASDFIHIIGIQANSIVDCRISDLQGKIKLQFTLLPHITNKLEISDLPSGAYLLLIDKHRPIKLLKR